MNRTSMTIAAALALGLAFPYLLFAFIPAAARMLPRPGMWMERLRQVLAFPLYGAAAWLLWVLAQQVDAAGLAMGFAGVIAIAFAAWLMGVAQAASLGYWVGEPYIKQGFMTRGVKALVPAAFDLLRLHRIEAACIPTNIASVKLLEKTGFRREGYARQYLCINGIWQDHLLYAQLRSDPRA